MSAQTRRVREWAFPERGRPAPGEVVRVGAAARAVLLGLTIHLNGAAVTWVSAPALARGLELDERTVRRALGRLESAGLITGRRESGKPTVWTVHVAQTPGAVPGVNGRGPRTAPGRTPGAVPTEVGSKKNFLAVAADVNQGRGSGSNVVSLIERRAA
jgi:DNA-binding transcriptional ArsR family regulator